MHAECTTPITDDGRTSMLDAPPSVDPNATPVIGPHGRPDVLHMPATSNEVGPNSTHRAHFVPAEVPTTDERRSLTELKGRHTGEDIWLIAAGASMNFVDPAFFDGKLTIGVNAVHRRFRCDYLVLRTMALADEAVRNGGGAKIIIAEHEMARLNALQTRVPGTAWYFPHPNRSLHWPPDLSVIGTDTIVVGASIIVSALHVAAYLGARNIVLCGHDCGSIDGKIAFDGYYDEVRDVITKWRMLNRFEEQTVAVREKLKEVYGCRVYSLNPFVNFGLEQHRFRREP